VTPREARATAISCVQARSRVVPRGQDIVAAGGVAKSRAATTGAHVKYTQSFHAHTPQGHGMKAESATTQLKVDRRYTREISRHTSGSVLRRVIVSQAWHW
jgi:hypothetical protein